MPENNEAMMALVQVTTARIVESIKGQTKPEEVLTWLATQEIEVITASIKWTQPRGWGVAIEPLLESMTPDQRRGFFAALLAVFAQSV